MMLPQRSHITRKRGVYYYRRRLPNSINREISISLKTRNFRVAEAAASTLNIAFTEFFATPQMKPFDVSAALRSYLKQYLESLKDSHLETPRGVPFHTALRNGKVPDLDDLSILDRQIAQFQADIRRRDVRPVEPLVKKLTEGYELTNAQRVEFGLGLLQAHVQIAEQSREWLTKGLVSRIDLQEPLQIAQLEAVGIDATEPGPTFSQVLPEFLNLMVQDEGWRGQTLAQNKTTYRMFEECCGDRPVAGYERKDLAKFYDLLRALPKFYLKSREWAHLTLQQIAEQSKNQAVERVSMKTVKRHMFALGRLFAYRRSCGSL